MTARTHECPTPGCDRTRGRRELACPKCWFSAPKAMRDAVWDSSPLSEEGQEARDLVIIHAAKHRFGVLVTREDLAAA